MSVLFPPPRLLDSPRLRGLRVGLLGGSFNPPHEGHVHISQVALRALRLDCVWWLVSPQNPLKLSDNTAPFDVRMQQCKTMARNHPRIVVSDIERTLGTVRTYDTLNKLLPRFPGTAFVWLTGFDNVSGFHRWHRWRDIPKLIATAHIARPPALQIVRNSPLKMYSGMSIPTGKTSEFSHFYTFWIMNCRLNPQSSTSLRLQSGPNRSKI